MSSGSSQPVRRGKKNAGGGAGSGSNADDGDELTKQELQIARYLRLSCAKKQGNLLGMKVDFFIGQKLVDALLESKWGTKNSSPKTSPIFVDRKSCVLFMQKLMNKQMFYRAVKVYKETADNVKEKGGETDATPSKKKSKSAKSQTPTATPKPGSSTPSGEESEQQKEVKRKFKLEMADEQKFEDSAEPFVWVFEPTSTKTYIIGSLLILGAIGICLFPLWPSQVREGVYYLSLAGASFLGAILGLALLKYIIYALVWAVTLGSVHFWLLPNLTEDVGFFESFVPLYKLGPNNSPSSTSSKTSKKSDSAAVAAAKKDDNLNQEASSNETGRKIEQSSILSGSTVEISNSDLMEKSSVVRRRKSSTSNIREEDGFELVDDDDAQK